MKILILISMIIGVVLSSIVPGPTENEVILEFYMEPNQKLENRKTLFEILVPAKQNMPVMDNVHNVNPQFITLMPPPPQPIQQKQFEYIVPLMREYPLPERNFPMMELMPPKPAEYLMPPTVAPPKFFDYPVPQKHLPYSMPLKKSVPFRELDYSMPPNHINFMGPPKPAQYMLPPPPIDPPMWHPSLMNMEQHSIPNAPMHGPKPNYFYYPLNKNLYFQPLPPQISTQIPMRQNFIRNDHTFIPHLSLPPYETFNPIYNYFIPQPPPIGHNRAWF